MPADQAFMDRIHRIQAGKTWEPEGVIVARPEKKKRKPIDIRQKRVSFILSLVMIWMLYGVFKQIQPELAAQFASGDFSAVKGVIDAIPLEKLEALPLPEGPIDDA